METLDLVKFFKSRNMDDIRLGVGILQVQEIDISQFFIDHFHELKHYWLTYGIGLYPTQTTGGFYVWTVNEKCRKLYEVFDKNTNII